jgi:hypothetical protein
MLAWAFGSCSVLARELCSRVPKDAFTLSDVREPTLTIVCERCGRRGRYNVDRLIAKHGNAKILYLLAELTSCPKTESSKIYDRCKARYEGLSTATCRPATSEAGPAGFRLQQFADRG